MSNNFVFLWGGNKTERSIITRRKLFNSQRLFLNGNVKWAHLQTWTVTKISEVLAECGCSNYLSNKTHPPQSWCSVHYPTYKIHTHTSIQNSQSSLYNSEVKALYVPLFPLIAQSIKNLTAMQEIWVRFLGWEDPLEKKMTVHSSILVGKSQEKRAWQATVHGLARVGHDLATRPPPPSSIGPY